MRDMPTHEAFRASAPHAVEGVVQNYAWGSTQSLPELLGRAPDGRPQAELWLGAHHRAPARVAHEGELDALVRAQPEALLGARVAQRFDGQLPFLFKVLAAAKPLSIQAHPDLEQAREGYAREQAAGIPLDAPHRNYRDANHKPELIVALTPFHALKGFRAPEEILERTEPARAALEQARAALRSAGLRGFLDALLSLQGEQRAAAIRASAGVDPWVGRLAEHYPDDSGALAPLFLNRVELQPGEGLYLDARELHAYLEGTGLELMASSDNVLRGGCTPKHVDREELTRVLRFEPSPVQRLHAVKREEGLGVWETPAAEFELSLITPGAQGAWRAPRERSADLLLCTRGTAQVEADGVRVELPRGRAALLPAAARDYTVRGEADVHRASVPRPSA